MRNSRPAGLREMDNQQMRESENRMPVPMAARRFLKILLNVGDDLGRTAFRP